jgi:hypothetical protein
VRRAFVLLAVAMAVLGPACARDEPRAAGVAERFLAAVNDQGRDNLREKSIERAAEYGDQALAAELVPANAEDDERHFPDFEVGKAIEQGDGAVRVPFRLNARVEGGDTEEREGTLVLSGTPDGWRVTAVDGRAPGERVPSEGGSRPSAARPAHWATAIVIGLVLMVISALIIRAQPESTVGARPE